MYSTVKYYAVQYSNEQQGTVQYSTVQYGTVQYSTVLCRTSHNIGREGGHHNQQFLDITNISKYWKHFTDF